MPDPIVAACQLEQPDGDLLFASLPIGIVILNPAGEVMAANPAAETILGPGVQPLRGWLAADPRFARLTDRAAGLLVLAAAAMVLSVSRG